MSLRRAVEITNVCPDTSATSADPPAVKYAISVRALCEFGAKRGDLDMRFTPAPSAEEGIAGHRVVTSRRPLRYQAEISLSGEYKHCLFVGAPMGLMQT